MNSNAPFSLRLALIAGFSLACSTQVAGAASIVASASVSCDVGGAVTTNSAPATNPSQATCGTPGQTFGSGLARFSYSGTGASAYLYAEPLNGVTNSVSANVSVDWSAPVVLTGGTGNAIVSLSYLGAPLSYIDCNVYVDGAGVSPCAADFQLTFNVPVLLRVLLSGSTSTQAGPTFTGGSRSGTGDWDLRGVEVRQGGLLVADAELVPVPEPAAWFIPGLTLLAIASYRRREGSPNGEANRRPGSPSGE